jgi:hypothetical protein
MLTLDKVLKGVDYREKVMLPYYEEEIEVRPLSDSELAEARRVSGVARIASTIDMAGNTDKLDFSKIDVVEADSAVSALHLQLAKMGIVDPLIRENAEKLMGGSLQIIGDAVVKLTANARNDILSFTGARKDSV